MAKRKTNNVKALFGFLLGLCVGIVLTATSFYLVFSQSFAGNF